MKGTNDLPDERHSQLERREHAEKVDTSSVREADDNTQPRETDLGALLSLAGFAKKLKAPDDDSVQPEDRVVLGRGAGDI